MERNATVICSAAQRTAANDLGNSLGLGPNTFSVPLALTNGVTDPALATHYAGSGFMDSDALDAFVLSLSPSIQVLDLTDGQTFDTHLGMVQTNGVTSPLYRVNEPI